MFCTLNYNNVNEADTSSLEMTPPPFGGNRRKVPSGKVACMKCRSSKLRCTSEPEGCERCLAKKIQCIYYPASSDSSTFKMRTESENHQNTQILSSETSGSLSVSSGAESEKQDQAHSFPDMELGFSSLDSSSSIFNTPSASNLTIDNGQQEIQDAMQYEAFGFPLDPSADYFNDFVSFESRSPESMLPASLPYSTMISKVDATKPQQVSNMQSCSCFAQAVGIHEKIEVYLVWGRKEQSDEVGDDILQQLKQILVDFETLLGCLQCTSKHEYVMLLLSMCQKIMATLEAICQECWVSGASGRASETGWETQQEAQSSTSSLDGRRRSYRVGKRQLDEDDERIVLQSLLCTRVAKLKVLVDRLEKVIREKCWPAHIGVSRDLQERAKSLQITTTARSF